MIRSLRKKSRLSQDKDWKKVAGTQLIIIMIPHDDDHQIIHSTDSEELFCMYKKVNLNDKKTLNNELNICNKQPLYKESTVDWQIEIKLGKDKNCLDPYSYAVK